MCCLWCMHTSAARRDTTELSPFYCMFSHHSRLSMDAFLGLNPPVESGNSQAEYKTKFQKHLGFAYKKATEEAEWQPTKYMIFYNQWV